MNRSESLQQPTKAVATIDPIENQWKGLFVVTEQWRSDLDFFEDEMRFFRTLIDKHFMRLTAPEYATATRASVSKLAKLDSRRFNLEQKTDRHLYHLTALIQDPFPHDRQAYLDEHERLESAMRDFTKDFRALKREIFQLTRRVMDGERISHLLPG